MADPLEYAPPREELLAVAPVVDGQGLRIPAELLEPGHPELVLHGPDGEVWGADDTRVTVALWAIARSLHAELVVERQRSALLERRTAWLYEKVTGHKLPEGGTT